MKTPRAMNLKILDIKVLRSLTRLLGLLHVPSCYIKYTQTVYESAGGGSSKVFNDVIKEAYGFGLQESKDFVEAQYDYSMPAVREGYPEPPPYMPYPRD